MDKNSAGYEKIKQEAAARRRQASLAGRDCGAPPNIANIDRRISCRDSLRRFCETYNPDAFPLAWSADHLAAIARIEEAAIFGVLYAFAMPRGSGKTTICRMAALWAVSYGLCRYVFVIGANDAKAADSLDSIKTCVRFLPLYKADFPEIAWPVECLEGIANRATGQLCEGSPTLIEWAQDRITLPTVPPPKNWPVEWELRRDGNVPTSGSVVAASGLTGNGIRGSVITLPTGEAMRPDLVLIDDPQTPESARSPQQNQKREELISADLLGLAGPGETISAVMPCTVIAPDDMVDRLLDRRRHPLWRGERTKLLRTMPKNMERWDRYFEVYRECALKEPPDFAEANAAYTADREQLDEGAAASWPERKLPSEVSAIQHAMHLYCRDVRSFMAEYQNDPLPLEPSDFIELSKDAVQARLNRHDRRLVPNGCTRLTAFVDVQKTLLYWTVCAWEDDFSGHVIDYGTWPEQRRDYFSLREANPKLADTYPAGGFEAAIHAGLTDLAGELLGREWLMDGGQSAFRIERLLVDSGAEWAQVVYRFCRMSPHAALLLPSKGYGIGAGANPMEEWAKKPGERRGLNWVIRPPQTGKSRIVLFDTNYWKSFIHARLAVPVGGKAALYLFGDRPQTHLLFAEHLLAEYRVKTTGRGRDLEEWKAYPEKRDNHWLDCVVGCAVAASVQGAQLIETVVRAPKSAVPKMTLAQLQAKARETANVIA